MLELAAGAEKNIEIKENIRGFEFGLSVAREKAVQDETEYLATMFDAQEVAKGKLIKVWRESGEDKASIVLTDGTEQPLINTRTIHYSKQDRVNRSIQGNVASNQHTVGDQTIPMQISGGNVNVTVKMTTPEPERRADQKRN